MKHRSRGFTLIEILVALTVFAILATMTSSALYYAFNTRKLINAQADKLERIQLAVTLLQRDSEQSIIRSIRSTDMRMFPPFTGLKNYCEFTRDGFINPSGAAVRSSLQRVAWVCDKDKLVRRTWQTLDPVNHEKFEDKILLTGLKHCQIDYYNHTLQVLQEWRPGQQNPLPKAIQLNLSWQDWGEMNLLFPLNGADYGQR